MKKHLYLVLFCVMLMPMFNTYAEEDNSLAYEEAKVVHEAINQPFYDSDDLVTRASFTQKLISMISFSIPDAKSYFSDVNLEAEYAPALTAAYEMGIINSKKFRPDDVITVPEAAAMMVRALGYEVYAQKDGGYPNGYLNRAGILELFKGIDTYEQVSERMAGIMFLNFLNADIAEISYDGSIVISEGKSILNTDYDIEYDIGIRELLTQITLLLLMKWKKFFPIWKSTGQRRLYWFFTTIKLSADMTTETLFPIIM